MKYHPIDPNLFIENRAKLAKSLLPNSIAVFNSNFIMTTNGDGSFPFCQNSDIFYFSGIDQEDTFLLVYPDSPDEGSKEILFVKETNEHIATWEGNKLSKEEASNVSGIKNVKWSKEFDHIFQNLAILSQNIYLNTNENPRANVETNSKDLVFIQWVKNKFPLHHLERLAPIMANLRPVKHHIEIKLIQNAIQITNTAFQSTLKTIKSGIWEFEIEAEIIYGFIKNRATGHAYTPIIASGKNACVLHYIENNKQCQEGDLILMDFGAQYAKYAADLTRTVPVNGTFTKRQKDIYDAVLSVLKQAKTLLRPGNNLDKYNTEVGEAMQEELIKLGLLSARDVQGQDKNKPLYKKYFMHSASHFLGLDVHDLGTKYMDFLPGMVFTCEPGIYVPEENMGIRLENNILITENGMIDLTADIPIEIEHIEDLMRK